MEGDFLVQDEPSNAHARTTAYGKPKSASVLQSSGQWPCFRAVLKDQPSSQYESATVNSMDAITDLCHLPFLLLSFPLFLATIALVTLTLATAAATILFFVFLIGIGFLNTIISIKKTFTNM